MARRSTRPASKSRAKKMKFLLSIYFAQRGVARPADERLSAVGFGRAHHRALAFIGLKPGLTVRDLARTLRVANQNLNRVLSPLVKQGYVEQRSDAADLRLRRLYLTEKGLDLKQDGFEAQFELLDRIFKKADDHAFREFMRVSELLMDAEDRNFLKSL